MPKKRERLPEAIRDNWDAHGLILDAQQKIADEFKVDPDSMRKLRNKHRELTKRRKKNIP